MEMGTPYITAAGNDGRRGLWLANSLTSHDGTPSIGSVDNAYSPMLVANGSYSVDGGASVPIQYSPGFPANWTMPMELLNLQLNGCVAYPNATYTANQVVLIPRAAAGTPAASCNQSARAADAGIRNIILYNNMDDNPTRPLAVSMNEGFPFATLDGIAHVDNAVGKQLLSLMGNASKITLDMPWKPENDTRYPRLMRNDISGGFLSNYTSW